MDQIEFISKIYKLKRDIISDGYDQALEIIKEYIPIKVHKYPSGTKCWTWTIPEKWTCEEGYVETLNGERIIDYNENPLSIASYSEPIDEIVTKDLLLQHNHMHSYLNDEPPFIFYYYQKQWGVGISKKRVNKLNEKEYRVKIKSKKEKGLLKVGDYFIQGESEKCVVLCTHLDHPVQVNDGLAGVATCISVMQELAKVKKLRNSYRLLIVPETIGSVAWLSHNEDKIENIVGGLFVEMTGLSIPPGLQKSYFGDTQIDKCFCFIHETEEKEAWIAEYRNLVGNDERQFNAPGVRIPMLSYARAYPWGHRFRPYKEYHSGKDNLNITDRMKLEKSKNTILEMIKTFDRNYFPINHFKGEIFLSGLNIAVDRHKNLDLHRNMLKIMDMIDGYNSIIDITMKLNLNFNDVYDFLEQLHNNSLISKKYE